jgi:rod shape-determining protein MreC
VYDRQVRRRRLVLLVFVVLSLGLLTMYFGESSGGGLHSLQRGALGVLGPIQEGASRALKPFRDLGGWVGDTFDAKGENKELRAENEELEREVSDLQAMRNENRDLRALLEINDSSGLEQYTPVRARVMARNANLFTSTVTIDKGSSSDVQAGQPVVNGQGLVGRVTRTSPGYSVVTLVTDDEFAAAARTLTSNQAATVEAAPNRPGRLELSLPRNPSKIRKGERIVTDGSTSTRLRSYYPANIPIGTITDIDYGDGDLDRAFYVRPAVDFGRMLYVEALTDVDTAPAVAEATVTP